MKLIIFDFDGVIIDSWEHSYKMNLREYTDTTPEEHRQLFNGNIYNVMATRVPNNPIDTEEKEKWFQEEYYPKKLALPMFPGIEEVIKKLASKYILTINSSASESNTKEFLQKAGLLDLFQDVYGKETSPNKAEKFKLLLEKYQCQPEDALLITDTVGDVLEARECGIKSLLVTYGYQNRHHHVKVEEEVIGFADKPEEILNFIS
jgi:phosphoglycolate phosphatase